MTAPRRLLGSALLVSFVLAVSAGGPPARADPADAPVVATLLDRTRVAGTSMRIDAGRVVIDAASGARTLDPAELREVRFPATSALPVPRPARLRVVLVAGEVLHGEPTAGSADDLTVSSVAAGPVRLSLDAIRSVEWVPEGAGPCHAPALTRRARPGSDVAYLVSGDEVAGTLAETRTDGIRVEGSRGGDRSVPWNEVLILVLENEAPKAPEGPYVEVETADGGVLVSSGLPETREAGLAFPLRSDPGTSVEVPWRAVEAVVFRTARWARAAEVPHEAEFVPYYGGDDSLREHAARVWGGAEVDRRISGCPLRVAGRRFRHGFGVHSKSLLTFPLDGTWSSFEASVGVDDERDSPDDPAGIVDVRVLGDDRVLWEAKDVTRGETPRTVGPLDLTGVRRLVLEVSWGKDLFFMDRADWLDPVFVKKP